ncbi:hypothetical protein PVAP13_4NG110419 [Panicum virgatum]|uniref:Secreted protein n=1 Tax=Panicum virgatum TaxID=38727 RepID=A0A8T0T1E1_PANVG|nr:hypothetical protein PVAP13_4NG110419 [Panicum virgatum]
MWVPHKSPIPFVFPILTSLLAAHRHGARQRQPARARVAAWRPTINRANLLCSGRPAGVVAHGWLRCSASKLVTFSGARQAI